MKQYGAKKATEFTRAQINVIFAKAKSGELKVEKWFIGDLYNLAEFYGYDDNGNAEREERAVLQILRAVFENDNAEAQRLINLTADSWFDAYSSKYQKKLNRTQFVA